VRRRILGILPAVLRRELAEHPLDPIGRSFLRGRVVDDLKHGLLRRGQTEHDTTALDDLRDEEAASDVTIIDGAAIEISMS
jgi:hypothetical protein